MLCAVPPHINNSRSVEEMSIVMGDSAEMRCETGGIPQPTVRWIRDARTITFVDHPNLRVERAGHMLRVHNMQLSDVGAYTCVASNRAGNASKQFILSILGRDATHPRISDSDTRLRIIFEFVRTEYAVVWAISDQCQL